MGEVKTKEEETENKDFIEREVAARNWLSLGLTLTHTVLFMC